VSSRSTRSKSTLHSRQPHGQCQDSPLTTPIPLMLLTATTTPAPMSLPPAIMSTLVSSPPPHPPCIPHPVSSPLPHVDVPSEIDSTLNFTAPRCIYITLHRAQYLLHCKRSFPWNTERRTPSPPPSSLSAMSIIPRPGCNAFRCMAHRVIPCILFSMTEDSKIDSNWI
jgi:hypothetical protein